jgi:hypothetical protein
MVEICQKCPDWPEPQDSAPETSRLRHSWRKK